MKILLVSDYGVPKGGAEIVTFLLKEGLQQRGHEVALFSINAELQPNNGKANYYCFGTSTPARALLWPANPFAFLRLRKVLTEFQPDVVHVKSFLSQLSPLILPLLREIPAVYHEGWYRSVCPTGTKLLPNDTFCKDNPGMACLKNRCFPVLAWPSVNLQLNLWKRWSSVFDAVVANSHSVADHLREFGIESVQVIRNGVPFRAPRPPLKDPRLIVYAGQLIYEKGVDVLLKAFSEIAKQWPDAKLLIAGVGPEHPSLQQLAKDLNLNDSQVTFLGQIPQKEIERLFEHAWIQVVPSRSKEAFGNVAAEAMMRGTAVIASKTEGLQEYIHDGKTGILVPPGNSGALKETLLQILQDKGFAEALGQEGREFAVQTFNHDQFIIQFENLYKHLIQVSLIAKKFHPVPSG